MWSLWALPTTYTFLIVRAAWELSHQVSTCESERLPIQAWGLSHPKLSVSFLLTGCKQYGCDVEEMLHSRGRSLIQVIYLYLSIHNDQ